ncbi:MAG: DNA repair protein RecO [Halofilum sp. (in: g-proteobacteria)]|nr:DNA repair protein RecO [Halofilum sp. (in: g-proteobacteria)]
MTAARGSLARGYVLHQRPYRNTSMLLEAFTADAGRVGLVARGARRQGSRTRALLEPFQPLLLSWSGRGELHTLTGVESAGWRAPPAGRALLAGFYCSELVLRLLGRDDPNPEAFAAYDAAVTGLADAGAASEPLLRRFELGLLVALGYAPPLTVDTASGDPVQADVDYDYLPEQGPAAAGAVRAEGIVRVPGAHLLALAEARLDDPAVLQSARRVLRAALQPHLGSRPLHSRELYRSMYGRN